MVVLAAIVSTPADRRAPRKSGDCMKWDLTSLRRLPCGGAQ